MSKNRLVTPLVIGCQFTFKLQNTQCTAVRRCRNLTDDRFHTHGAYGQRRRPFTFLLYASNSTESRQSRINAVRTDCWFRSCNNAQYHSTCELSHVPTKNDDRNRGQRCPALGKLYANTADYRCLFRSTCHRIRGASRQNEKTKRHHLSGF